MQKHSHHTTRQVLLVNIALLFRDESFDSAELGQLVDVENRLSVA